MVEPVVENPETLSKIASVTVGKYPEKIIGIAPNSEQQIHAHATMTKVPLIVIFTGTFRVKKSETKKQIHALTIGIANGRIMFSSPQASAVIIGIKNVVATIAIIVKMILKKNKMCIPLFYSERGEHFF